MNVARVIIPDNKIWPVDCGKDILSNIDSNLIWYLSNRIQLIRLQIFPVALIGGMDLHTLLADIADVFNRSDHRQSQNLLKKIIHIAASKLLPLSQNPNVKDNKINSSRVIKSLLKLPNDKLKKKVISKNKLRRTALKKIANQNKLIHIKFLQSESNQQPSSQKRYHKTQKYTLISLDQEEQKLQSNQNQGESQLICKNQKFCQIYKIEPTEQKKINNRKSPRQLIKQKINKSKKNFQTYLKTTSKQSKAEQITCPICIQILVDPVSTICAHSFCFRCLDESLLFSSNCPVCRQAIKGLQITPCKYLGQLIKLKSDQFLDDQQTLENFRLRKDQNSQWKKQRFVNPSAIKSGDSLDVRDTQNIWCRANILKIYEINGKVSSILVHYLQWAKIYDQIIDIKSVRLAPFNYFSSRTDLPRYNLGSEQQNLRGVVITGNNNQNSMRPGNGELSFSNILQLNTLTNRISSLQSNLIHQIVPMSFFARNNQVGFLHEPMPRNDDDSEEFSYHRADWLDDGNEQNDQESSSLGSFAFGRPPFRVPQQDSELSQNMYDVVQFEQNSYILIDQDDQNDEEMQVSDIQIQVDWPSEDHQPPSQYGQPRINLPADNRIEQSQSQIGMPADHYRSMLEQMEDNQNDRYSEQDY